jgi:hypothetical protein
MLASMDGIPTATQIRDVADHSHSGGGGGGKTGEKNSVPRAKRLSESNADLV